MSETAVYFEEEIHENPWPDKLELILGMAGILAAGVALTMLVRGVVSIRQRSHPGPGKTAVIGDSLTANANGYVDYLAANIADRQFDKMGIVGQGTALIKSRLQQNVIGHGFDEVIIEGGINDIRRADAVDYVTANLQAMVQMAKAAGLKVVLVTLTPYEPYTQKILQINDRILRNAKSWGVDVVVDLYNPLVGTHGELRQDLVGDAVGLHPNHQGHLIMGETIRQSAYR